MADDLGVVFVSYHSERLVAPLADAYRDAGVAVRIVDNSGTYGGGVDVVAPGRNVGFGGGCNLGARMLPPEVRWVCFHNPDVDPAPDVLRRVSDTLASIPSAGAIAPIEVIDGTPRRNGYAYPSPPRELYLGVRLRWQVARGGRPRPGERTAKALAPAVGEPGARARRFPAFCFVVVDRAAFDLIGGFDERYFLYAEDLDLWHRLGVAGRPGIFDPSSVIHHHAGTSSPVGRTIRELFRWTGVELFAERFDRLGWRPYRALHRSTLWAYPTSPLRDRVSGLWSRGLAPAAVAAVLRSDVESGVLDISG